MNEFSQASERSVANGRRLPRSCFPETEYEKTLQFIKLNAWRPTCTKSQEGGRTKRDVCVLINLISREAVSSKDRIHQKGKTSWFSFSSMFCTKMAKQRSYAALCSKAMPSFTHLARSPTHTCYPHHMPQPALHYINISLL